MVLLFPFDIAKVRTFSGSFSVIILKRKGKIPIRVREMYTFASQYAGKSATLPYFIIKMCIFAHRNHIKIQAKHEATPFTCPLLPALHGIHGTRTAPFTGLYRLRNRTSRPLHLWHQDEPARGNLRGGSRRILHRQQARHPRHGRDAL